MAELEKLGVPCVVFTTTAFEDLTRRLAQHSAPAGARIVVVPHPLGGTDQEQVRAWGVAATDDVLAALGSG